MLFMFAFGLFDNAIMTAYSQLLIYTVEWTDTMYKQNEITHAFEKSSKGNKLQNYI